MAGSSVPLYWRIPHPSVSAEAPADGAPLEEALALSYGGLEAYGCAPATAICYLPALLCMIHNNLACPLCAYEYS